MDPNETLVLLREWVFAQMYGGDSVLDAPGAAQALQGLDEWLSKGGFPPADWKPNVWLGDRWSKSEG